MVTCLEFAFYIRSFVDILSLPDCCIYTAYDWVGDVNIYPSAVSRLLFREICTTYMHVFSPGRTLYSLLCVSSVCCVVVYVVCSPFSE